MVSKESQLIANLLSMNRAFTESKFYSYFHNLNFLTFIDSQGDFKILGNLGKVVD